jgi:cytochrome bd-type quinol oxidase subunit 2
MFKKDYLPSYFTFGILAAILFCVPMIIFISSAKYSSTWWLYVGNVLFLLAIILFMIYFNKKKGEDASTQTMVAAGHITTVLGIIISIIVAIIAVVTFMPDIFSSGQSDTVLENAPSQTGTGKTHGMVFMLFMNTIIGNLVAGSFPSIILSYTAKKDQTKDRKSEVLNN